MDEKVEEYDWNKIQVNSTKAGFRDGVAEGQQAVFQESFDKGYEDGFKNGFILGQMKANLTQNSNSCPLELEKTKRGNCVICKDEKLLENSISHIENIQNNDTKELLEKLHSNSNKS